jgi:hypothetical protein
MAAWYRKNLGIQSKGGYADFVWRDKDHPEKMGHTAWAIPKINTTYFGQSSSRHQPGGDELSRLALQQNHNLLRVLFALE